MNERNKGELTCMILSKYQQPPTILQSGFKPLEHPSIGTRMQGGVEASPLGTTILRDAALFARPYSNVCQIGDHSTADARLGHTTSDLSTGLYTALRFCISAWRRKAR